MFHHSVFDYRDSHCDVSQTPVQTEHIFVIWRRSRASKTGLSPSSSFRTVRPFQGSYSVGVLHVYKCVCNFTYLCLVDSSTITLRSGLFPV